MEMIETKKLDWSVFQHKFHESWHEKMKPAVESPWMYEIYQKIKEDAKLERILPNSSDTFKAFETTDLNDIKVIFYLLDPYPRLYRNKQPQATGIAMSCDNSPDGKIKPSLEKFYDAICDAEEKKVEYNKSLVYLHEQGCMMLNTELTCKYNKTGSHKGYWEPFQKYFLEDIMGSFPGIIYVLCGEESKRMEKFILPMSNYIRKLEHPAAASHKHTKWDYKDIFGEINHILKQNKDEHIFWDKRDWDKWKEPPF